MLLQNAIQCFACPSDKLKQIQQQKPTTDKKSYKEELRFLFYLFIYFLLNKYKQAKN